VVNKTIFESLISKDHENQTNFIPFIRAFKSSKKLELWIKGDSTFKLFKTYDICYYSGNMGPKLKQGDLQSPEGFYFVKPKQLNPNSRFHLSFNIGYPNEFDRFHKRTGSAIMIHGSCVSIGCYAMTDSKIEEIYTLADAAFRNGQPFFQVHIFPFTMTDLNVKNHRFFKWYEFWKNLKPGFDYFEKYHLVPDVLVKNGKYHFQ